ncbi:MAG: STAS domain-containing protein [Phycisphaeraceae bacterium]
MPGITEQRHGAVLVVKPDGPLIQDDARLLGEATHGRGRAMLGRIAVDLSASPYIDSVGLEALLDLADELDHFGQTLRLASVSPTVREVLDLTGLTNRFEFHDDANLAVRSFL